MPSRREASGCGRCSSSSPRRRLGPRRSRQPPRSRAGRAAARPATAAPAARAAGDYLYARAFAEPAETADAEAVALPADATLWLARGEALQRRQTRAPDTTVVRFLARCALKTATL